MTALLALTALLVSPLVRQDGGTPLRLSATTGNPVTPGDFRGYGFDQCMAPSGSTMDTWMRTSPFLAAGIYISGNSRACRSQPNLTPGWVSSQLAAGWKLLPITLGPQASCNARYPRYSASIDPRISASSTDSYATARSQGRTEAARTVSAASALGITRGSTLWYDLEAFDITRTACRESALSFLSAYTRALQDQGYVSGLYSSAGSGILMVDDVRRNRPTAYTLPDQIWIARWDGEANTSTTYISDTGWNPGRRAKQYQGGHNETWGRVTINIDRDYLDVGRGAYAAPDRPCDAVRVNFTSYPTLTTANAAGYPLQVKALQCLLKVAGSYAGTLSGTYNAATIAAVQHWAAAHGVPLAGDGRTSRRVWIALLASGGHPILKIGSAGNDVRRLQRALNAAVPAADLKVSGVYGTATSDAVHAYQAQIGLQRTANTTDGTWARLKHGLS
ncbi:MAG TPA: glycoside hydrolase domain-containing protein [Nocardioides sp.]|nr:glycoside hydrolase domain-containing protein [Nocardioides sp.]